MKTCSKLCSIFSALRAEIKVHFNTFLCILQSENAKEYFSEHDTRWILSWSSCVDTLS